MKQIIIGHVRFGYETIELVAREGQGGEFYACPERGKTARIKIGMDYDNWEDVVRCLLHELLEYGMFRENVRYVQNGDVSKDSGNYMFMFSHSQFSNIIGKTSEAVSDILPEVAKRWKKWEGK